MVPTKKILDSIPLVLKTINIPRLGEKSSGKVRDYFLLDGKRVLVTTDRLSAFDRVLGCFPYKGQVLNQLSEFWFEKTKDIIFNHMISVPDPNVMIVKNCKTIPIEMVVRGFITGVTDTSIWGFYQAGERVIYGIKFPDGLKKNQKLPDPLITPTTKAEQGHDERLTEKEILKRKIVTPKIWNQMKTSSLALFKRGQKICDKGGIILVDTKYEFGLDEKNKLILIDEIHTPDSSRFWLKGTHKNFDKEFLRIWFAQRGYKGEGQPPKMPTEFMAQVSARYIKIYEKITGKKFQAFNYPIDKRIKNNLKYI
ncbi:phosphoribosylaminoimidazolesuccinocarboxamide synthase, partial [Candidatus Roizmanbacteria bacterium]|nr:phosphoribosylaminoimidazolesuccinocarboxamide synthase [Candidatus Roizmanbacteria bacterium]